MTFWNSLLEHTDKNEGCRYIQSSCTIHRRYWSLKTARDEREKSTDETGSIVLHGPADDTSRRWHILARASSNRYAFGVIKFLNSEINYMYLENSEFNFEILELKYSCEINCVVKYMYGIIVLS